jgi:hypothetical protein
MSKANKLKILIVGLTSVLAWTNFSKSDFEKDILARNLSDSCQSSLKI